jgi:lipid A disaccharide synthetase
MYVANLLANQKTLTMKASRNFTTTIAILAASRSHDAAGAKLMNKIRELSDDDVRFIGIGGPEMQDAGLDKNYADINKFLDKPLLPYKNFLRKHINQSFHPILASLHKANRAVGEELTKNNFWTEAFDAKPKVILTLGNQFFMKNTNQLFSKMYYQNDTLKPPLIHYDNLIINQRQEFEEFCDYWLYTVPREPINWAGYKFPSTYVGSYGASRAVQYLYRSSPRTKHLVDENSVMICKEYNAAIIDSLIEEERARFRQANGLSEETTLFYTLPGNTEAEIKWAIPLIANTAKVFLNKYNQYSAENFAIVVTSDPKYEDLIQQEINKQTWACKLIVARTEEEKYSALAAADMGAVTNGDAVCECAALHLPIVILNHLSFWQAYFTLLYNSFNNNLNIALGGEAYPELLGQAFPEKIVEYWGEWFEKPRKKYDIIERFENISVKLLPEAGGDPVEEHLETKALAETELPFYKFYDSEYLAAKKILEAAKAYDVANSAELKRFELLKARKGMLESFAA